MTSEERDSYSNLIYLCRDHHTQIDKQEADFSVDFLLGMKADHETLVQEGNLTGLSQVAFPELERATEWVGKMSTQALPREFKIISPEEKISRNDLAQSRVVLVRPQSKRSGAAGVAPQNLPFELDRCAITPYLTVG